MKIDAMFGMGCLTVIGSIAMYSGLDTGLVQFIVGGIIGMVSTVTGVTIAKKSDET